MNLFSRIELMKDIYQAQMSKNVDEWINLCVIVTVFVFFSSVFLLLFLSDSFTAIAFSIVLGALSFSAMYRYPSMKKKARAGKIEKELPIALRTMATQVSTSSGFTSG